MRVKTAIIVLVLAAAPATREAVAPSPASAVLCAYADAEEVRALDMGRAQAYHRAKQDGATGLGVFKPLLPYVRYFWFPYDPATYEDFLITAKLLFNKLSTQPEFHTPKLVASNVLRIDVRALGWAERQLSVLEKFAGLDPYFHQKKTWNVDGEKYDEHWPGGTIRTGKYFPRDVYELKSVKGKSYFAPSPLLPQREIDCLRAWLYSEVPVLNAEHFYLNVVRQQSIFNKEEGVGYYEWFGRRGLKTRDDYFEVIGLDEAKAVKLLKEWRALIVARTSGVSQNSRQIVALNGVNGRAWGTLDVFAEKDRGLAARRLRRGEFVHDAEEWYGFLANELPITFLAKADGTAQAKAPPEVGGDRSELNVGNDPAIHDDLSCMRCHGASDMLRPFKDKDWVRSFFAEGKGRKLTDPDADVELELRRQYLSDVAKLLKRDQETFADAVARCTQSARHPRGLSCGRATEIYCKTWNRLAEKDPKSDVPPVTLAVACRELGTTPKVFLAKLAAHYKFRGQGDLVLARFTDEPPGALSREEWESSYAFAAGLLLGQAVPEKIRKEKKQ